MNRQHPEGHDLAPEVGPATLAPDPPPVQHVGGHGGHDVGRRRCSAPRTTRGTRRRRCKITTCDTTVEITETLAYLMSLTLDGWAMRSRHQRLVRGPDVSERRMPPVARAPRDRYDPGRAPRYPSSSGPVNVQARWTPWRHLAEPVGARLGPALEGARGHRHQPELGPVAQVPLEVVEQAPDEVAPQVDPLLQAAVGAAQRVGRRRRCARCRRPWRSRSRSRPRAARSRRRPGAPCARPPGASARRPSGSAARRGRWAPGRRARNACACSTAPRRSRRRRSPAGRRSRASPRRRRAAPRRPRSAVISAMDSVRPDRELPGAGAQRVDGQAVGAHHRLVHRGVAGEVLLHPGRVLALEVPHDRHHVGLVDGAGPADEVAQVRGRPATKRAKRSGASGASQPPRAASQQRRGEVVEGDDGDDPVAVAGGADAPVVLERRQRELTLRGLDAAPLEREAVGAEPHVGHQLDVLAPAVERVAGVAAGLARCPTRVRAPRPTSRC